MYVPRLLAITDRRSLARDLAHWAEEMGRAGVPAIQIREKDLPDRELFALARSLRRRLPPTTQVLVNGRADVAWAAGCQGVHLPVREVSTSRLRRRFPPPFLIGRSTHSLEEVRREQAEGADYVTYGPVFFTPSKAAHGTPVGPAGLAEATAIGLPVLALGGVDGDRLDAVVRAGAAGAAGIRVFFDPAHARRLVELSAALFPPRQAP